MTAEIVQESIQRSKRAFTSPAIALRDWLIDEILLPSYRPLIPDRSVWEWADDNNVYLDAKAAREPGFYRSAKTAHTREFMETFTDPRWREDLVMKSSRSGFTEAALNIIRFMPQHAPGHVLFAIDSDKQAKAVSKNRLFPTLASAAGGEYPDDPDDAGIYTMFLRNMTVYMTGSYSPGIYREKWLRVAILDECEVKSEIEEEGSTLDLAESRLKTEVGDGKLFAMSKAKKKGTAFHKRWCAGTRSVRLVPCPHCGTFQELTWSGDSATNTLRPDQRPGEPPLEDYPLAQPLGRVRFDHCREIVTLRRADGTTEEKPGRWDKQRLRTDTYYQCVIGCRIDFDAPFTPDMAEHPVSGPSFSAEVTARLAQGEHVRCKQAMMLSGRWLATNPRPHPRRRSRHISDLYSLYDDLSLCELALIWIDAQGDAEKLRHFFNNNLGLTFAPRVVTFDESLILECRADYGRGECPFTPDLVALTFDTQQHHYAGVISAWLADGTCAVIDWFDAIADDDIVTRFRKTIPGALRRVHPQPGLGAIDPVLPQFGLGDAAGAKGRTADVYDLCLKIPGRLYASFGRGGLQITTPISQRTIEWRMQDMPIYLFSDDTFKGRLYSERIGRIREIKTAQAAGKDPVLFGLPPRLYLPRDTDAKLTAELAGERRLEDGSWQDPAPGPNHLGDALKNGLVLFEFLRPRLEASRAAAASQPAAGPPLAGQLLATSAHVASGSAQPTPPIPL